MFQSIIFEVIIAIITILIIILDGHLILLLVLHEQLMQLLLIDLDHIVFTLALTHDLLLTLIIVIIVAHELAISLAHHLLLHLLIHAILFFDLVLHAFDTLILNIDFVLVTIIFITFFHAVLPSLMLLVHLLLLLLDGLSDCGLLLRVELVEVGQVLLVQNLLLLLGQGDLVLLVSCLLVDLLTVLFLLVLLILVFLFILVLLPDHLMVVVHLMVVHLFLVALAVHLLLLIVLLVLLIDHLLPYLPRGALHHLARGVVALHHPIGGLTNHHLRGARPLLLHKSLAAVLCGEVGRRHVESIVVLGADQEFSLFVSQVLVRVVPCLAKQCHEVLQLLDLVQVMDERFADLFDEKRSVSDLELHLLLDLIIAFRRL